MLNNYILDIYIYINNLFTPPCDWECVVIDITNVLKKKSSCDLQVV